MLIIKEILFVKQKKYFKINLVKNKKINLRIWKIYIILIIKVLYNNKNKIQIDIVKKNNLIMKI